MRYIIFLTLFLVLGTDVAAAQESRYRVEILVLQQLQYSATPLTSMTLEDFSDTLDFLTPVVEEEDPEADAEGSEPIAEPPVEDVADIGEPLEPDPEELLNAVVHVPEMGPQMQDAWRRLRLSGPLRPLQYLAWEQGPNAPFPVLRIHDLEVVWSEDPWAEQRALLEQENAPLPTEAAAALPEPEGEEEQAVLPPPILYYQLDGAASLTRSRFLHLRLAVEWRTPVYENPAAPAAPDDNPVPIAWQLHRLEQSRPVRTGRMEYFDGPVLGVLAWVSEVVASPEAAEQTPME